MPFVDTVTADDVKAAIADVDLIIKAVNFSVSLAVNGTLVVITIRELAIRVRGR